MAQIKIDGETHAVSKGEWPVRLLLDAAGVEPAKFDLVWLGQPGGTITYTADEVIEVSDGDDFVTARISAHTA